MPLTWDFTKCEKTPEYQKLRDTVGQALIFLSIPCGLDPKTWDLSINYFPTFVKRVLMWQLVTGPLLVIEKDGERKEAYITEDMMYPFIGMKTNTGSVTEGAFKKRLISVLEDKSRMLQNPEGFRLDDMLNAKEE